MSNFSLTTHQRDSKGRIVKVQPYRLHIEGQTKLFERPPGSGLYYSEGGQLMKDTSGDPKPAPPLSHEQLVEKIRAEERAKIEAEMKTQVINTQKQSGGGGGATGPANVGEKTDGTNPKK